MLEDQKWFWEAHSFWEGHGFGKGTTSVVPLRDSKDVGFSP